jgi:hypothetical protein
MSNPYDGAPGYRRWSRGVAAKGAATDPVVSWPWKLVKSDKVAAAGSCFAQHMARYLKGSGFSFLDTEPPHPVLGAKVAEEFGYGVYSARFGNIYSSRQLLQLIRRSYGKFRPTEDVWEDSGRFFDPWRPAVQPDGFATKAEFDHDRAKHLAAVRRMFEELDVFVFTLGLTETWISTADGAAFPVCPGTVAGRFDPAKHAFVNLDVEAVTGDLTAFVSELRAVNPKARVIFTVSPVPLAATAEDRHVLVSTIASKSVLRAAADKVCKQDGVDYFPSYEIITGPQARGRYFADDLRSITEDGVEQVMRLFFRHVAGEELQVGAETVEQQPDQYAEAMKKVVAAMCDEEMLDRG